jgi:hypothetical protein
VHLAHHDLLHGRDELGVGGGLKRDPRVAHPVLVSHLDHLAFGGQQNVL